MEPLHIGYYREYPPPPGGCNRLLKRAKIKYDGDVKLERGHCERVERSSNGQYKPEQLLGFLVDIMLYSATTFLL